MFPEDRPTERPTRQRLSSRWRLLQATLFSGGAALVLVASLVFAFGDRSDGKIASQVAGETQPPDVVSENRAVSEGDNSGIGGGLRAIDGERWMAGVKQLVADVQARPTSRPTPTPQPQPTPPPAPAPRVQREPQAVAAPPPTEPPPPPSNECPNASMTGQARALFEAANGERASRGLPALATDGCLVAVAQRHAQDMASKAYFGHTSPQGWTVFGLLRGYGVRYGSAGENLARNDYPASRSVSVALRDLMASPSHRANILSAAYTHMGVGAATNGQGMTYYAMVYTVSR